MKNGKLIIPVVIFGSCVFFYFQAETFRQLKAVEQVGPDFWPQILLLGGIILSVFIFFSEWKERKSMSPALGEKPEGRSRAVWAGLLILGYILLLEYGGFVLLTPIFVALFMILLGARKKVYIAVGSILFVGVVTFVFGNLLFVALPRGQGIFRAFSLLFH